MDKAKKKRMKRYLTWGCLAGLVALLTVMPLLAKSEAEADGPVASILTATAEEGSIASFLHGGGTLQSQTGEEITIPTEVKITEFLVKNNQFVTEGTPLAAVDKVSVMNAILGVTDTMEYLQEKLEDARDESVEETIHATAGGRVKKIFAKEGESVQEVMLRDGCLAILSIDGMMAVKIEGGPALTTGESVDVRLSDGEVISGRVLSSLDGVKVITVEDDGYAIGETVTVSTGAGEAVGSGSLYIHNAWKATAYSGTISKVRAKEEATLSEGSTLFTLTDTDYLGQMQHRASQHREYEELLQKLHKMYATGTIDAPCDGVVTGVDEDSAHLLSAQEDAWEVELLNQSANTGYRIMLLSDTSTPPAASGCTDSEDCPAALGEHVDTCPMKCTTKSDCKAAAHESSCITLCIKADRTQTCGAQNHYGDCVKSCSNAAVEGNCIGTSKETTHHYLTCIESCDETDACPATRMHKKTCIKRCGHADVETGCDAEGKHYTDCIKACDGTDACTASKHVAACPFYGMTFTAYAAKVDSVGTTDLVVYQSSVTYEVVRGDAGYVLKDGTIIDETLLVDLATITVANASTFQSGDIILIVTGQKPDGTTMSIGPVLYSRTEATTPETEIGAAGMTGNFGGFGNYSSTTTQETESLYDLKGSVLMTVTPQDTMELVITLDEQDIAKAQPGMEAEVKVGALRNATFPAEVTKVGYTGTNNGGSSKFQVTLVLDAQENMLSGMSATVQIPLLTKDKVLTIPLAALDEQGAKTVVYRALDEKTGLPGSPAEVETGISDADMVEILSGLNPGDTIYYSYYDTLELDTSAKADRFTFG